MTKITVIDTGLRTGRENIAHDQAMVEARLSGVIGDSFKFIHFKPCALIGRHQALSQELKLDACKAQNVQTVRRMTGGGAIYFDEGQLGWALICDKKILGTHNLTEITKKICEAAALGLSTLGVDAQFRPRNDIEVDGQKISGTGGFFDGNILMFQGTVLVDLSPKVMMSVLNVPAHKLEKRDLKSAAQRVTSLKALLGYAPKMADVQAAIAKGFERHLGFEMLAGDLPQAVEDMAKKCHDEEIGTDAFVAEIDAPAREAGVLVGSNEGGNLKAHLRLEGPQNNRVREVVFTGDVFVTPPRALMDLESHLRGNFLKDVTQKTQEFFSAASIGMISLKPSEFSDAVLSAASNRKN
ncbi:MAG: lipoate--protein ligase family protein [Robiginitomaculum sp.]